MKKLLTIALAFAFVTGGARADNLDIQIEIMAREITQLEQELRDRKAQVDRCSSQVSTFRVTGISLIGLTVIGGGTMIYQQSLIRNRRTATAGFLGEACTNTGGTWANNSCACPADKNIRFDDDANVRACVCMDGFAWKENRAEGCARPDGTLRRPEPRQEQPRVSGDSWETKVECDAVRERRSNADELECELGEDGRWRIVPIEEDDADDNEEGAEVPYSNCVGTVDWRAGDQHFNVCLRFADGTFRKGGFREGIVCRGSDDARTTHVDYATAKAAGRDSRQCPTMRSTNFRQLCRPNGTNWIQPGDPGAGSTGCWARACDDGFEWDPTVGNGNVACRRIGGAGAGAGVTPAPGEIDTSGEVGDPVAIARVESQLAAAAGPLAIAEANFAQAGRAYDAAIEARTAAGTAQAGAPGAVIAAEAIVNTARTARDEAQEALYTKTRELTGLQGADEPDQTAIATKQREVNTAQGELTTAQLNLSQAETGLTQARATIGAAGTAWTAADAEVARTRNERDRLEVIRDAAQKTFDDLEVELKRLKEPQG